MISEIKNYGFVEPLIEEEHYVLGGNNVTGRILQENGQWDLCQPEYEPQFNEAFDSFGCTVWGWENAIEFMDRKLYDKDSNYSERFIYILANIVPPGADPHYVAEVIREVGLIPDEDLPMVQGFKDFLRPRPMSKQYLTTGKEWKEKYDFRHEWLWTRMPEEQERIAIMKESLKYSVLPSSVTAWHKKHNSEVYVDNGLPNTHWGVVFGWTDLGWKFFDSYDKSVKIVSFSHKMKYAKRLFLPERAMPLETDNAFIHAVKDLWGFFANCRQIP